MLLSLPVLVLLWLLTQGGGPAARWALFALGVVALGQTYLEFAAYVFRGQQDLLTEARIVAGARLLTAGLGVAILLAGGGLLALALISMASVLLLVGASLHLLWRTGWLGASAEPVDGRAGAARAGLPLYRRLLREAAPLGLSIFLSIAYSRLAVLLLQARLGEAAVATFSAAHRLVEPSQILPASLIAAVFPAFSHALYSDPPAARRLGARASLLLAAAGAGAALTLWLAAGWLVPLLYGDAYVGSAPVLRVLGLSILPAFVNYSLTHYLIARGQQGVLVIFSAVMLAAHAGLSWLWMPRWGALGPAISVVIAESLLLVFCSLTLILTKPLRRPGPDGESHVVAPPESARPDAAGAAPPV